MVIYICSRCNYTTNSKGCFRRHLNRKFPCRTIYSKETILEIKEKNNIFDKVSAKSHPKVTQKVTQSAEIVQLSSHPKVTQKSPDESPESHPEVTHKFCCEYCDKEFAYKQGKYRHQTKRCKIRKSQLTKIEKMEINNGTINTTNSHNKLTQNITINNYGKENLSYITENILKKLLHGGAYHTIPRLIKYIHFNEKHPENHNIAITNKKSKYCSIRKNNIWQLSLIKDMLNDLIDQKFSLIYDTYMDIHEDLPENRKDKFDKFTKKIEMDEEKLKKYLEDKIHILLLNCTKMMGMKCK